MNKFVLVHSIQRGHSVYDGYRMMSKGYSIELKMTGLYWTGLDCKITIQPNSHFCDVTVYIHPSIPGVPGQNPHRHRENIHTERPQLAVRFDFLCFCYKYNRMQI